MKKTVYKIAKMDCPSEEQLIRMKLADEEQVRQLDFDIPNRMLTVYHAGDEQPITHKIDTLHLGSTFQETTITDDIIAQSDSETQRKLLWQVLAINLAFFVIEIVAGFISGSMGLVADSLDMLADAIVYALALFAVGTSLVRKRKVARLSGYLQLTLAVAGVVEVGRRFLGYSETPVFQTMIIISMLALLGNAISLYLLKKSKSKEAHMQASMIFTSNDIIVNIGVISAGVMVYLTDSKIPDLVIGLIVFVVVTRGALKILKL